MCTPRRTMLAATLAAPVAASAQEARFPNRPIRIIVPYALGGTTDIES